MLQITNRLMNTVNWNKNCFWIQFFLFKPKPIELCVELTDYIKIVILRWILFNWKKLLQEWYKILIFSIFIFLGYTFLNKLCFINQHLLFVHLIKLDTHCLKNYNPQYLKHAQYLHQPECIIVHYMVYKRWY